MRNHDFNSIRLPEYQTMTVAGLKPSRDQISIKRVERRVGAWMREGEVTPNAQISVQGRSESLIEISFVKRGHDVSQDVELKFSNCPFDGNRRWIKYPDCGKRWTKLHLAPDHFEFTCRECVGLQKGNGLVSIL